MFTNIQDFLDALRIQNWSGSAGPMRLSHKLAADDFSAASLPANIRVLMEQLVADGGTPATVAGNLNRAFVESVFEKLRMSKCWRESIRAVSKVLNETDVFDLHRARCVAQTAGFLTLRKKRFQATKKGSSLLAADQAGEFYRAIFLAYLQKFNLGYEMRFREVPELQDTLPAILWRIDAVLRDWTPVLGLAPRLLLPVPLQRLREAVTPYISEENYLRSYVFHPLDRMGLLQNDDREENPFEFDEKSRIKTTPLWRKFLWFDWQP